MADDTDPDIEEPAVSVSNRSGACPLLLVCEHASNHVPTRYNDLGIPSEVLRSHIAWDPGARVVAAQLSRILDAPLVARRHDSRHGTRCGSIARWEMGGHWRA